MRGEFEKQVQQKMEELKLAPSAPVWEKIQLEIKPGKDRRRLLFWLPVCVLLLGGGAWWMVQGNRMAEKTTANHQLFVPTVKPVQPQVQKHREQPVRIQRAVQNTSTTAITLTPKLKDKMRQSHADRQRNAFTTALQQSRTQRSVAASMNKARETNPGNSTPGNASLQHSPSASVTTNGNNVSGVAETKNHATTQPMPEKQGKVDSALTKPVAPAPKPHSKWTFGITAFSGLSGISTGSSVFARSLAADLSRVAPYANTAVVYIPPATERNNTGFGIGLTATRPVYRRMLFTTGLQYSFYSTRINVGQKVSSAPLANFYTAYQPASVPFNYYTKAINGSDYINRYHFLSIPVGLQYQLFRNTPLSVSASISAQQLISTNALQYDSQSQIYYEDNDFLKKTQVFSDFGLSYSVIRSKKLSIQLGPEFQYGLTDFKKEHASNTHHVFSLGVSSKILFHK